MRGYKDCNLQIDQSLHVVNQAIEPCTSNSMWKLLPDDTLDESAPFGTSDQLKIIEDISSHGDMNNYMARWDNSL